MDGQKFAQCPGCQLWFTAREIIDGSFVEPIGMTLEEGNAEWNLFYFNHKVPDCGTTFVIRADSFDPFIEEPIPPRTMAFGPDCEGHCTSIEDRRLCQYECRWAPYRRFLIQLLAKPRQ